MRLPKPSFSASAPDTKLWVGDCLTFIPRMPALDLCFADPPFNLGVPYADDGGKSDSKSRAEYLDWTRTWVTMLAKALRPGGSLFIHVPDHIVGHIRVWLENAGLIAVNWIILHQEFGQYCESKFICSKVHLLYFCAPPYKARTWNVEEVLEPSTRMLTGDKRIVDAKYQGRRPFLDLWAGPNLGRVQGNNAERRENHENQLPETYLMRIIRCASNPGDLVVDPFSGSGTTQTVARALKRRAWGIELQPKLAASAWERIMKGPVRDVHAPLAAANKFSD